MKPYLDVLVKLALFSMPATWYCQKKHVPAVYFSVIFIFQYQSSPSRVTDQKK